MIPREIAADLAAGHAYVDLVEDYLRTGDGRATSPPPLPTCRTSSRTFDEPAPARGRPLDEVLDDVRRRVLPNALWLQDPMHMGHQLSVPLPAAIWAEPLIAALNPSHAVAELSPVTTAVERRVVRWLADLARLGPDAGGTFAIGATEATFSGLAAARAKALPRRLGARACAAARPSCSAPSTRTTPSPAPSPQLGIGANNVVRVPSDERRAIDPEALERLLATETRTRRGGRRDRRVDGRRRVRRPRRDRPDLRRRAASGCTSTARTAPRRCSRPPIATAWPASSACARWRGIRTR